MDWSVVYDALALANTAVEGSAMPSCWTTAEPETVPQSDPIDVPVTVAFVSLEEISMPRKPLAIVICPLATVAVAAEIRVIVLVPTPPGAILSPKGMPKPETIIPSAAPVRLPTALIVVLPDDRVPKVFNVNAAGGGVFMQPTCALISRWPEPVVFVGPASVARK